jgi:hypothetical protein
VGSAVRAASGSAWRRVTNVVHEVRANRARAAAAAAAAREANAAALRRETPISVPLAPSRSTGAGEGQAAQPRERVEWPAAGLDGTERPAAPGKTTEPDGEVEKDRPRLDFPDEF